jgi:arsenate reductase-like glutaredoxin family protein
MGSPSPSIAKSPDDETKEELLNVLQKMNKKVKALLSLRLTLTERIQVEEKDKELLIALVRTPWRILGES